MPQACFAAGTKLYAKGIWGIGYRKIEEITTEDWVLSRYENAPESVASWKRVEEAFTRFANVLDLVVEGQTIRTTGEHPFYVEGQGWSAANTLEPGSRILSLNNDWLTVDAVTKTNDWETVYNLRVEDWHTYFVGDNDWGWAVWSHNTYEEFQAEYKKASEAQSSTHPNKYSAPYGKKQYDIGNQAEILKATSNFGHEEWYRFRDGFKKPYGLKNDTARELWWLARDISTKVWKDTQIKAVAILKPFMQQIRQALATSGISPLQFFYRGSLATGWKVDKNTGKEGRPWDLESFDIDVYTKNNTLADIPGTPLPGVGEFIDLKNIDKLEGFKLGQTGNGVALIVKSTISDAGVALQSIFSNNPKMRARDFTIRVFSIPTIGLGGNEVK